MIVDDNPSNLKLLDDMLRQRGYEVRSFPRGRLALASAEEDPPDLVLLDVNMPEMNGYEVCDRIRKLQDVPGIPVLFISALNQREDRIRGFRAGAADYITKPLHFEEVHARVETHLRLRRARLAEQELLEHTLRGAIGMLSDLVHYSAPEISIRSRNVRETAEWIAKRVGTGEKWQYNIAGTLCLIGCVTLPQEVFRAAYADREISPEASAMFRAHPESAALLLKNLPRLEPIAEMIRLQQDPDNENSGATPDIRLGARILFLAVELDRRLYRGMPLHAALRQVEGLGPCMNPELRDAMNDYPRASKDFQREPLPIRKLIPGFVLEEDVVSKSNRLVICPKGTILTHAWIERLKNFRNSSGVAEPLQVLVPTRGAASHVGGLLSLAPERSRTPERNGGNDL